jgi:hypothetical protein
LDLLLRPQRKWPAGDRDGAVLLRLVHLARRAASATERILDRKSHRVMVMPDGFAWNGETFASLSEIAFAAKQGPQMSDMGQNAKNSP